MTRFEQIGVNHQNDATSVQEATRRFANSCKICSERGVRIECDRCAIRITHEQTVAFMRDYEESESTRRFRELIAPLCRPLPEPGA